MATIHDRFRNLAVRLIRKYGSDRTATFYRRTETLDPLSGAETIVIDDHTIWAVTPPVGKALSTPMGEAVTTEHQIRVIVPALGLGIVPMPGDQISIPGLAGRFGVTDCKPVQPDGDPIAFAVSAAKGA